MLWMTKNNANGLLLCFRNTCTSPGIGMLWTEWGAMVEFLWGTVTKNLNRKLICLTEQAQCCHRWVNRFKNFGCLCVQYYGNVWMVLHAPHKTINCLYYQWIIGLKKVMWSCYSSWDGLCETAVYFKRITEWTFVCAHVCVRACVFVHACTM